MRRQRFIRTILSLFGVLVAGVLYGIFVDHTGYVIPCVFHLVTGLKCPGCGVTRMCIALMHLDVRTAFYSNQALFVLMPVLAVVFLKYIADYIKTGRWEMRRWQNGLLYVSIAILLVFAVIRNVWKL